MPPVVPPLPLHLGALHPVEQLLTFVLAFGPFVVLGVVIWVRRRADAAADAPDHAHAAEEAPDVTDDRGASETRAARAEPRAQRDR